MSSSLEALRLIARLGLTVVEHEVVEQLALAVWHSDEPIALLEVDGPHVSDAVHLVERLALYSVVPQERKRALMHQVRATREKHRLLQSASRFAALFERFLPRLQPLQSRHFAAPTPVADADLRSAALTPADGNVFEDLGFAPEEAKCLLAEADEHAATRLPKRP